VIAGVVRGLAAWRFRRRAAALAAAAGFPVAARHPRAVTLAVPVGGHRYSVVYTADDTLFVVGRWRFSTGVPPRVLQGLAQINTALGTACGLSWHRDELPDGHALSLRLRIERAGLTPAGFRETVDGLAARVAGMDDLIGRHCFPPRRGPAADEATAGRHRLQREASDGKGRG
jgi:hypothetical protein